MTGRPAPWESASSTAHPALHAWSGVEGVHHLEVIEDDVARLIHDLAAARAALTTQEETARADRRALLLDLLEVTDAFDRVLANIASREAEVTAPMRAWVRNFRTISRLLSRTVANQGVSPIDIATREFDPDWHTAVETVQDPTLPVGTIVEEIARGYVWQRQVLRKSAVVVVRDDAG